MLEVKFTPQIVKHCQDVRSELERFSKNFKIDLKFVWFEILDIQTLIDDQNTGFKVAGVEDLKRLDNEIFYNKEKIKFKQVYDIRIIPKKENINIALRISPFGDKVALCLYDGCDLIDNEVFYKEFITYIETLLVYEGIFIRRKDFYKDLIKSHIKKIIDEKIAFPYEFVILKSEQYHPHQEAYYDFLPQMEWERENKKIDNAFYAVNKGEEILKYFKSKKSKSGRNLYGEYIPATQISLTDDETLPKYNPQEVDVLRLKDEVLFQSKLDAYVKVKDNEILFFTQNEFRDVDALNTPPLLGGYSKGIELHITATDSTKDAINSGVILEASKINIIGNIGPNVKLHASELVIDGHTHQDTEIIATKANIGVHKGNLVAQEVNIKSLESGFVQAENLVIDNCLGGSVLSKDAKIAKIASNNKITVSHRLYIGNIEGSDNVITLSSLAYTKTKDIIENLVKKKDFLIGSAKKVYAKYHKILSVVKKNKEIIDGIGALNEAVKKRMMQDKKVTDIYDRHDKMTKELRILKQELLDYQHFVQNTIHKLTQVDEEVTNAQIYCDDSWGENTKIIYQREFPKKEIRSLEVTKDYKGGYKIDKETKEIVQI